MSPLQGTECPCDESCPDPFVQNLFVLCHGEQVRYPDNPESRDGVEAEVVRPWDLPLTDRGKLQAWRVGRKTRLEGWTITRIVAMSPLLRCVQTAVEVIRGLCMLPSSVELAKSSCAERYPRNLPYLSTSIKLPIDLDRRESVVAADIVQNRYTSAFQRIANRYPDENILCVTDGEGVKQSVSMMWPRTEVYRVAQCAYTHGQRPNFKCGHGPCSLIDDWELVTESGLASGVYFRPL